MSVQIVRGTEFLYDSSEGARISRVKGETSPTAREKDANDRVQWLGKSGAKSVRSLREKKRLFG